MKIDSVITMEVKTREEELEELLSPDGELKAAVDKAVIKIRNETKPYLEDKWWEELNNAINKYIQYAIEQKSKVNKILDF